jgi:hypothetical protein
VAVRGAAAAKARHTNTCTLPWHSVQHSRPSLTLFLICPSQPAGSPNLDPMWWNPKCTTFMTLAKAGSSSAGQSHAPLSPVSHRKWSRPSDLTQDGEAATATSQHATLTKLVACCMAGQNYLAVDTVHVKLASFLNPARSTLPL